ncbi:hypothetical protein [Pseudoflavonifractor capillosus]|uniref:Uncharacterized protein n=1 Tax=Pseudoflavonifractor capillosus TaxID=106588 RepID=A0A921ST37_9FIRM|nr:hypothetical protein [Pseudoflavonifractor capillosus]HJG87261.1 hypothetical protein [Pseudoflavonifractor capillosus]
MRLRLRRFIGSSFSPRRAPRFSGAFFFFLLLGLGKQVLASGGGLTQFPHAGHHRQHPQQQQIQRQLTAALHQEGDHARKAGHAAGHGQQHQAQLPQHVPVGAQLLPVGQQQQDARGGAGPAGQHHQQTALQAAKLLHLHAPFFVRA